MMAARFYYPVFCRDEVLVYYAYEEENGTRGVGVCVERGEVVAFPRQAGASASAFCRYRNAREKQAPGYLPARARQFFLQCTQADGKP